MLNVELRTSKFAKKWGKWVRFEKKTRDQRGESRVKWVRFVFLYSFIPVFLLFSVLFLPTAWLRQTVPHFTLR
jgi:hypothetical protein